jgi:phosphopantothenate--cysteine ligase
MKILITSGGTKVPIDRVRHIANMSSGTFGSRIALAALEAGHEVMFFHAAKSKTPFTFPRINLMDDCFQNHLTTISAVRHRYDLYHKHYEEVEYTTFTEYMEVLESLIEEWAPDVIVLAAAVSDYGVDNYVDGKIRTKDNLTIQLEPLPKVISKVSAWGAGAKVIGFKLLVDSSVHELIAAAQKSAIENDCEFVVANDLRDIKQNRHTLNLVSKRGLERTYESSSVDPLFLAERIVHHIENGFAS